LNTLLGLALLLPRARSLSLQLPVGFKPDRPALFSECAPLTNFELGNNKTEAIAVGKTRLSTAMKTGIGVILDAWEKRGDADKRRLAFTGRDPSIDVERIR
jgi:hypothetical protein